jgi:hypothetical protein
MEPSQYCPRVALPRKENNKRRYCARVAGDRPIKASMVECDVDFVATILAPDQYCHFARSNLPNFLINMTLRRDLQANGSTPRIRLTPARETNGSKKYTQSVLLLRMDFR